MAPKSRKKKDTKTKDNIPANATTGFRLVLPPIHRKAASPSPTPQKQNFADASLSTDDLSDGSSVELPEWITAPGTQRSRDHSEPSSEASIPMKRSLASEITLDSGEEDELIESSPPSRPASKRVKSTAAAVPQKEKDVELPGWATKLALLIPSVPSTKGAEVNNQRKRLSMSTTYEDVIDVIYRAIGCADVKRKPELLYKLTSRPQKEKPVSLQTGEDWAGLLETLSAEQQRKKAMIDVSIIVSDQYLESLRMLKAEGKPNKAGYGTKLSSKGKAKGKNHILDLNASGSDDGGDDGGFIEKESEMYVALEKALSRCQRCGPTKFCKVNRAGEHVNLTFQQRRGWAVALAQEIHGVTLETPPRGSLFSSFHGGSIHTQPATPQTPTPMPTFGVPPPHYGAFSPFMVPQWPGPMAQPFSFPPPPIPGRHDSDNNLPSSDPPDDTQQNPYPDIAEFLTKLHASHPRRRLDSHIYDFEEKDYYNIDELAKLSEERLTAEFNFTPGNAQFLLTEVKREIKRVDKGKRRA